MYVLVACEESQRVCKAFRDKGHIAFSCDILPCSGGFPEWHIQSDVLPLLNGFCTFCTMDGSQHILSDRWDLIIAHPPCTRLCLSGQRWLYTSNSFYNGKKRLEQIDAIAFFMAFVSADCDKIAIENPIGIMSKVYRKPDCIYNPFDFQGETDCKRTCLWLKNLPPLLSDRVEPLAKELRTNSVHLGNFNGKSYSWGSSECSRLRSQTPLGVARAMAEQWG